MDAIERRSEPTGPIRKLRVGEWLNSLGMISQAQLAEALAMQQSTGKRIGDILIQMGYIREKELSEVLMLQEALAAKSSLTDFPIDSSILSLLPETFSRQHFVIPLIKVGRRLVVAVNRSDDARLLDHITLLTGYFVIPIAFRQEDLQTALSYFFENKQAVSNTAIEKAVKTMGGSASDQAAAAKGQAQEIRPAGITGDAPIIELVNSLLTEAVELGVSDVHLEPMELCLQIRFRIDGVLNKNLEIPKAIESSVITRFKVLSNMNITEKRRPQDGRFSARFNGEKIDFRVACIPTHWGEKIVLRLLRPKSIMLGMNKLGFEADHAKLLDRLLNTPTGIMVVTGPTGSGKTTTLYAALQQFDRESDSIVTIEDPVEFPVEGISQIQINAKIEMTFASALRTILRLDPDIVMLGEIRDHETLETAAHAAMTGHFVLSTLHTNDAISTIGRMIEMGLPPYVVSGTLRGIIAQRLVRRICSRCAEDYEATETDKQFLGVPLDQPLTLARGKGCETCNGSGHKGQLGVYEILVLNRHLQAAITDGATMTTLAELAVRYGFRDMLHDAKRKIMKKMTTPQEVIRILGQGNDDED